MKIPKIPGWLNLVIKIFILALIVFLIVRKIDERLLLRVISEANPGWITWAVFWFAVSKFVSALRFNTLLRTMEIRMTTLQNLRLYWLCMYYNLLLPGGISGDAYKIKVLMDRFGKSFKRLLTITLVDRLSGMMALGQLILVLFWFVNFSKPYRWWTLPVLITSLVVIWFGYRLVKVYKIWLLNTFQSLGVQIAQVLAALGLVFALHQQAHWHDYLLLFLVSSVVAMIPITIGGAGAREITFLYGSRLMSIDPEKAVAIAFLFYLTSTFISFLGISQSFSKKRL